MTLQLQVLVGASSKVISVTKGENLLKAMRENGIQIQAPCGGHGTCGKCEVEIKSGKVLACNTVVDEKILPYVRVAESSNFHIVEAYNNIAPIQYDRLHTLPYGIAIDIGTTTIAMELLEIKTGERLATYSLENAQRKFGADVMARISHATKSEDARAELTALIQQDICSGILHIINRAGVEKNQISNIVIAGNTTMLHILHGKPCNTLGVAPFTPIFLDMKKLELDVLNAAFGNEMPGCKVTILPGISTFVGADIAAGILCAGWPHTQGKNLLIDLGTNGEMALFFGEKIVATATAAGPAFEGGNISMGIGSVDGAISKVKFLPQENVFIYESINNVTPSGICGTGVIDIAAELITNKLVDETGQIESDEDAIEIAPGIHFTQKDIREIQLAKSAVRAGIEILLDIAGTRYDDISNVFLAGGFGNKIDIKNAAILGLIPQDIAHKVVILGNASLGGGSKVLLSQTAENDIVKLVSISEEVNLATHPKFNFLFMEYMDMESE